MNEKIKGLAESSGIHFSCANILDGDANSIAKFVSYPKFEEYARFYAECKVEEVNSVL
jgi:hypothetical protein